MEKELEQRAARIQIDVFQDGKCLSSFTPENSERIVIGRSKTADIVVPHQSISGIHAMIRVHEENRATLYDLGSKNGTYFGDKRVVEKTLEQEASFTLGKQEFRVRYLDANNAEHIAPETCLFWRSPNSSNEVVDIVQIENGAVVDLFHVGKGKKLDAGLKLTQIDLGEAYSQKGFLRRKMIEGKEHLELYASSAFNIELYDGENSLIQKKTGEDKWVQIPCDYKVRITFAHKEIQIHWREDLQRYNRRTKESDQRDIQRSFGSTMALCIALLCVFSIVKYFTAEKKEEEEIDLSKKSSYFRVKNNRPAAAAPAPSGVPQSAPVIANQPAPKKAATKQESQAQKTAAKVSSVLSSILDRSKKSAVTQKATGNKVAMAAVVPIGNQAFQAANHAGTEAGTVDGSELSKMGGGKTKGLGGFGGKGAVNSLGRTLGGTGNAPFGIKFSDSDASIEGGIDRAAIAAVVRANIGQIKHCYERQLIVDPNLSGKLVAKWTINAEGVVNTTGVKNTTLGSRSAVDCMLRKIATWKFPKPRGGGRVVVSYPFLFKAVN